MYNKVLKKLSFIFGYENHKTIHSVFYALQIATCFP